MENKKKKIGITRDQVGYLSVLGILGPTACLTYISQNTDITVITMLIGFGLLFSISLASDYYFNQKRKEN